MFAVWAVICRCPFTIHTGMSLVNPRIFASIAKRFKSRPLDMLCDVTFNILAGMLYIRSERVRIVWTSTMRPSATEVLELTPPGHLDRSVSPSNLAVTILTRFEQVGDRNEPRRGDQVSPPSTRPGATWLSDSLHQPLNWAIALLGRLDKPEIAWTSTVWSGAPSGA